MFSGIKKANYDIDYGVNAFYLARSRTSGLITQENLFTNLAYHYSAENFPIYAIAKARIKTHSKKVSVTIDAGVGPNFMKTSNYQDWSLDGGVTVPDGAFTGKYNITLSATLGIGIQLNELVKSVPIEIGYRFFYLGQGEFKSRNNQLLNSLKTGNIYANALVVTATI